MKNISHKKIKKNKKNKKYNKRLTLKKGGFLTKIKNSLKDNMFTPWNMWKTRRVPPSSPSQSERHLDSEIEKIKDMASKTIYKLEEIKINKIKKIEEKIKQIKEERDLTIQKIKNFKDYNAKPTIDGWFSIENEEENDDDDEPEYDEEYVP